MNSQLYPILLSLIAAIFGAGAQYFYKIGATNFSLLTVYKNIPIILGVILFSLVLFIFIFAFKLGGKMFVIYPVYATTYIWSGLIAYYILGENINIYQIIGVGLIITGVVFVSLSQVNS